MNASAANTVITLRSPRRTGLLQAALTAGNALLALVRETVSGLDHTHQDEIAAMDSRMLRDIGVESWIDSRRFASPELQYPRL